MAYLVARGPTSWEFRESRWTPSGPRSHTLARFRHMDGGVVAAVMAAAAAPVEAADLWAKARRAGVPEGEGSVDGAARLLLAAAAEGRLPAPVLQRRLRAVLQPGLGEASAVDARWLTAAPAERGEALRQLLLLSDALPARPHAPLRTPFGGDA